MGVPLTEFEISRLLETDYGIDCRLVRRLDLEASGAEGFVLDSHGTALFLKPFPNYLPVAQSVQVARVHVAAVGLGAPLAPLVPTRCGEVAIVRDCFAGTLQHWLPGDPAQCGLPAEALAALRAIDAFQGSTNSLPIAGWKGSPFTCLPDTPAALANLLHRLEILAPAVQPNGEVLSKSLAREIDAAIAAVAWTELSTGWLHGDPGPDNVILRGNSARLVDTDDLRPGQRLWYPLRMVAECAVICPPCETLAFTLHRQTLAVATTCLQEEFRLNPAERAGWRALLRLAFFSTVLTRTNLDWELLKFCPPALSHNEAAVHEIVCSILRLMREELP